MGAGRVGCVGVPSRAPCSWLRDRLRFEYEAPGRGVVREVQALVSSSAAEDPLGPDDRRALWHGLAGRRAGLEEAADVPDGGASRLELSPGPVMMSIAGGAGLYIYKNYMITFGSGAVR